jgi:alkylation response protein AidB-like acyl-CoA dehydrogenase
MLTQNKIDHNQILNIVEDIVVDYLIPNANEIDEKRCFPRENIDALAKEGLLGLMIPKELGGLGGTPSIYKDVVMALSKACASTAMVFVQHTSATSIMLYGKQQPSIQDYLKRMAEGTCLATIALSEAGSGCYFFLPVSQAERIGHNSLQLNMKKTMVTSAGEADLYIVNTKSTFAKNSMQSDFFILPKNYEGFSLGGIWEGMGLRGNQSAPMDIENCKVSEEMMIGSEGEGFKIVRESLLPMGQIGISSINIGIARAIYEESLQYVKKRSYAHIDASLSSFQSIQQTIATMRIICDQAEKALNDVVNQMEEGELDMVTTLEIKVMACEAALKLADLCLKVCGGHAYSSRSPLERYIRDSKAGTVMGPTPEILKELVGKILLDVPTQM